MAIKSILLVFLVVIAGCGKEIKLSSNKLESYSNVTQADPITVDKNGTLIRKNISNPTDRVLTGGQTLNVSKYSSYQALTQINSRAEGIQVAIRYKGKVKGSELLLEIVEFQ